MSSKSVLSCEVSILCSGVLEADSTGSYVSSRLTVERGRKLQRFMSQPFQVAEVFTGMTGKYLVRRRPRPSLSVRGPGEIDVLRCDQQDVSSP